MQYLCVSTGQSTFASCAARYILGLCEEKEHSRQASVPFKTLLLLVYCIRTWVYLLMDLQIALILYLRGHNLVP